MSARGAHDNQRVEREASALAPLGRGRARGHALTFIPILLVLPLFLYASLAACLLTARIAWRVVDGPLPFGEVAARPQATLVFDRQDRAVFSFSAEQRVDVPLDEVSPAMIQAVRGAEDRRFFSHHGLDPIRIAGAAWRNYRAGRIIQGGSTITQQLARTLYFNQRRTWRRKIREALMATDLETRFSKRQILEQYLNTVYFGEGLYGVEAAARGYFGKRASDLDAAEAALLAGLIRSPSQSPTLAPAVARARRDVVLRAMRDISALSEAGYRSAIASPVRVVKRANAGYALTVLNASIEAKPPHAPNLSTASGLYFFEEVRRELVSLFGSDRVLRDGLRVYTTVDVDLQREAEETIASRIAALGKNRPRLARELQGALVSLDVKSGEVRAIVGGRDFSRSSYNRATQARRQPGSAFKPIVFAVALERGWGPGSLLKDLDTPIDAAEGQWLPSGEHEASEYTLRRALKVSSNRASAQLLQQVGVSPVLDYAHRMGIESKLPAVPSLALGTGGVTLLELASAYQPFANEGMWVKPSYIRRVEDRHGNVIWSAPFVGHQALSPSTAYLMSSMLRDVIAGGTGYLARSMGFKRPAAGKTGTTDDFADAWFVGYTPRLITGVWFGFDMPQTIFRGGFGGRVAVPAWTRFMMKATAADPAEWYRVPADVEKLTICRLSGALATEECKHPQPSADGSAIVLGTLGLSVPSPALPAAAVPTESGVYEDYFALGTGPTELCPIHHHSPDVVGTSGAIVPASIIH